MRHHRDDIVQRAVQVLDDYGLASLTMRRLGSELGLQPSAIYHHFPDKQTLLAAVADEILTRGQRTRTNEAWEARLVEACHELRDAMLAYRDGADLVATIYAFGLGAQRPVREFEDILGAAGFPEPLVGVGSRTLLHFVFGHTFEEQAALQAESAGAIPSTDDTCTAPHRTSDFDLGLTLVLNGITATRDHPAPRGPATSAQVRGSR